ncbi:MAG: TonB-dependent receptor [Caldiserica bacterium]|nr:TonB-dependent receptor [Caldisericota bacterium]
MRRFYLLFVLLISTFTLLAQTYELEEVVVTATRSAEEISRIPANVTVITEKDIENSQATNVADLIKEEMGIVVRDWVGNGKTVNVDMRGFGETSASNVLVLVDGMRVNAIDLSGVDWSQIPLERIERIEIVRGAGSVLYGDNAAGGVINIITKKGKGKPSLKLLQEVGSYNFSKTQLITEGAISSLSYAFSASSSSNDGYRENGFLKTKDSGGKISYQISPNLETSLSFGDHWDHYGMPGWVNEDDYKNNPRETNTPDDFAKTKDKYITFGLNWDIQPGNKLYLEVTSRKRNTDSLGTGKYLDSWTSSWWNWDWQSNNKMDWAGVTPRYVWEKSIAGHDNKLTLGIDYWRQFYKGESAYRSIDTSGSGDYYNSDSRLKATKESKAGYIRNEFSLAKNLQVSAGYRKEDTNYAFFYKGAIDSVYFGWPYVQTMNKKAKVNKKVEAVQFGINYLYGENNSLFFNYSTSFRYPLIDEYFNYASVKLEDLEIQKGKEYEVGVRQQVRENLSATATLFLIENKDEIFYNPLGGPFGFGANENYDKTRRSGIELQAFWKPTDKLDIRGNYTYLSPILEKGDYNGNIIPGVPRNKGAFNIAYRFTDYLKGSLECMYVGERYAISDWDNKGDKLSEYWDVGTWLSYSRQGWTVLVGVKNLFNEKYAEYGTYYNSRKEVVYYPSPERNYYARISYKKEF